MLPGWILFVRNVNFIYMVMEIVNTSLRTAGAIDAIGIKALPTILKS